MLAILLMTVATLDHACCALNVSQNGVQSAPCELSLDGASTYDALNPKGKRKAPSSATMSEDRHLQQSGRRQLIGGVRELRRNSSFLGWMVRRHLDYVTAFRFESMTGDHVFDKEMEHLWEIESDAETTDIRGIFDLDEYMRCAEAMAVLDGDLGTVLIDTDSGRLQGIEGDRIRDPQAQAWQTLDDGSQWYNGVHVNSAGRPMEYGIHRRRSGGTAMEFERIVSAGNFHLHAYLHRFDQYRGVSPVTEAYNQLRDLYEAEDYAMVRSKIASLFAAAVTRNADAAAGKVTWETDDDGNPIRSSYNVDFGKGPLFLDMDPGDDFKFLDSDNPGANLQEFWRFVSMVALKSLDIPYGMFDESEGNFFGNKTAWLGYDRACETKRRRCVRLRNRVTAHKYRCLIKRDLIKLPKVNGRQLTVADRPWKHVARKMPWWRPLEEVTANLRAIEGGLTTPQRVCQESDNGDWYENVDEIAKAKQYAEERGVTLSFALDAGTEATVYATRGKE